MLSQSPFLGHRKVKARLAAKGIRVGKNRVLRLMRAHGLLAPVRRGHPRGDRSQRPDPDRASERSVGHGRVEVLDEGGGLVLVLRRGRPLLCGRGRLARCEVGRPLGGSGADPPGPTAHMGGFGKAIAMGLGLRHDWGSQCRAKQFQAEIQWLGLRSTPAFVGEPEATGSPSASSTVHILPASLPSNLAHRPRYCDSPPARPMIRFRPAPAHQNR